jgi:hypothetical protein
LAESANFIQQQQGVFIKPGKMAMITGRIEMPISAAALKVKRNA